MAKNTKTVLNAEAQEEEPSMNVINQWWLHSNKATATCDGADINIINAWKITTGHPTVTIAFLDSQIEDHKSNLGHGVLCAELAAGKFGVAPACSSLLVKIPFQSGDDVLLKIFEDTAKKADIICCSWAVTPVYRPVSLDLFRCIREIAANGGARKNGCVICFAAGNYNAPVKDLDNKEFVWLDETLDFIRVTKGPIENGFASHPHVITVAACTSLNKKTRYSNWGDEIDLCAPSNNFHPFSKRFEVEGQRSIDVVTGVGEDANIQSFGGTSASAALVAGVAGLVKSANPRLSASRIRNILQQSADKITDETNDPIHGNLGGKYIEEKCKWFGYGKLNAGKAVEMATSF